MASYGQLNLDGINFKRVQTPKSLLNCSTFFLEIVAPRKNHHAARFQARAGNLES